MASKDEGTTINAVDVGRVQEDPTRTELDFLYRNSLWQGEEQGESWHQQHEVEQNIFLVRKNLGCLIQKPAPVLFREKHVSFLMRSLDYLSRGYASLSAARPWVMFWTVHALDLLGATLPPNMNSRVIRHLLQCWDSSGGAFGGGLGQVGHMASTYAAVATLCTIATPEAYNAIDVNAIHGFMHEMKQPNGSFRVEEHGEADVRAVYSALAVASMTGILARDPKLFDNCWQFVASLQAFDGGFGGEPGNEAHGGNTYCAVASLVAMGKLNRVDVDGLLDWAAMRQMGFEGGFQGRTNKLVDSCYSFWVGSLFPLLCVSSSNPYHPVLSMEKDEKLSASELFNGGALQSYILECCQSQSGGFCDKPTVPVDLLHTCYALSGLSVAQQYGGAIADGDTRLRRTDPVYNISVDCAQSAVMHFVK